MPNRLHPRSVRPLAVALAALLLTGCVEGAADAADPVAADSVATTATAPAPAPAAASDARPTAGRWAGVAEKGYKGDSVLFTVAPDGRSVSDVEFRGHWRCGASPSSRTIKRMDVGHVPGSFAVAGDGTFGEEKREPYLLWTVAGRFGGARAASGTIRIEYDTECDTYVLEWTAAPV